MRRLARTSAGRREDGKTSSRSLLAPPSSTTEDCRRQSSVRGRSSLPRCKLVHHERRVLGAATEGLARVGKNARGEHRRILLPQEFATRIPEGPTRVVRGGIP